MNPRDKIKEEQTSTADMAVPTLPAFAGPLKRDKEATKIVKKKETQKPQSIETFTNEPIKTEAKIAKMVGLLEKLSGQQINLKEDDRPLFVPRHLEGRFSTKVIKDLSSWIYHDVTEDQIQAVLWAIMMQDNENDVVQLVKQMRAEHRTEMEDTNED